MTRFAHLDKEYGFPEGTMHALLTQESNCNVDAVSPVGARGAAQFMPATRQEIMEKHGLDPWSKDIDIAARCGAIYLREQVDRFGGDLAKGLAAYNAGGGRVNAAVRSRGEDWLAALPGETRNYVPRILERAGITGEQLERYRAYS